AHLRSIGWIYAPEALERGPLSDSTGIFARLRRALRESRVGEPGASTRAGSGPRARQVPPHSGDLRDSPRRVPGGGRLPGGGRGDDARDGRSDRVPGDALLAGVRAVADGRSRGRAPRVSDRLRRRHGYRDTAAT